MNIAIINGPNLNLLGTREPEIYGKVSFEDFLEELKQRFPDIVLSYFQSNEEGRLISKIQEFRISGCEGIVINAAAYSHTSIALADVLKAVGIPAVEVHISNIFGRERFRHHSYLSPVCKGVIAGLGLEGYALAVQYLSDGNKRPLP
ncbi:MAG TPA: type II 3-dehydroquinate dehydratase [Edaphocola sp.]|nr:type II 3-dehydroquinate dehydratase [Edaphocola sp.]